MAFAFNPLDVQGITGPAAPSGPVSRSVIQALLAKHGASMPKAGAGMASAPAPGAVIGKPDLGAPAAVDNLTAQPSPQAPPPGTAPSVDGGGDAMKNMAAQAPTGMQKGFMDRIGDFLHSDEGRAQMLRFGMGAFNGGMGGGLQAATSFADQRRAQATAAAQAAAEFGLKQQEVNNNYNLGFGKLGIEGEQIGETARHNHATEGNEQTKTQADIYKHNTPSGDARLQSQTQTYTHITPSGDTRLNVGEKAREHDTTSADVQTQQTGETQRATAKNQNDIVVANLNHPENRGYTETKMKNDGTPPGWFSGGTPNTTITTTRAPLPSQVPPNAPDAPGGATKIGSDAEYAALPSGARFMGPDGQIRIKP